MERTPIFRSDQLKSIGLSLVCCVGVIFVLGFINMTTDKKHAEDYHILLLREDPGPSSVDFPELKFSGNQIRQATSNGMKAFANKASDTEVKSDRQPTQLVSIYESRHSFHKVSEPESTYEKTKDPVAKEETKPTPSEGKEPNPELLSTGVVLKNRHLTAPATLHGTQQEEGIVAVEITVDAEGNVTEALAVSKGSTITDRALWLKAQQAARQAKFDRSAEGNMEQHGVYYFKFSFL